MAAGHGLCCYLLPAKVAEAEVGFRLHAAKVASLACNGPAQMKSFYLIPHPAPLLSDGLLDWI